jgi:hypothetical protein
MYGVCPFRNTFQVLFSIDFVTPTLDIVWYGIGVDPET